VVLDGAAADEQARGDLGVGQAGARQPGDLALLGRQVVAGFDAALAGVLAGGLEVAVCPRRERLRSGAMPAGRRLGRMDQPRRLDLRSLLTRAEAAAPVGVVDAMAAALLEMLGARDVSFLIADFSGRSLNRLGHTVASEEPGSRSRETSVRVPLEGTPYGEALAGQRSVLLREGDDTRILAPVTSRGEAVGVLELILPFEPAPITLEDVELAAHQLAYMVIANRRYTDLFEWGQRTVPLSLAAEIQRRLLPASFTCEADQFTLAGWLEPAGQVGGDTFDFSLDRNTLHVSMTDAMGHSVRSALLATLVVGALRNTRRRGASLIEQAQSAHAALLAYTQPEMGFVTGLLLRVDLVARTARVLNAGHPRPFRLRHGRAEEIHLIANQPFGVSAGASWHEEEFPLEAGDRVIFVTDGMLERDAAGVDVPALMLASAHLHPRETIQYLTRAVLDAVGGQLRDDATSLCFDWHGGVQRERESHAGAEHRTQRARH
jgi:serine phosphatase RsbU (regulator of sigma subunit)